MPFRLSFIALLLVLTGPLSAADKHFELNDKENIFFEVPLRRPRLQELGISPTPFPVSGLDEKAQAFFNQGVGAIHGFWIFEAERNFRAVIELQPEHPFGYAFAAFAQLVFTSGDNARGAEYVSQARAKLLAGKQTFTEAELLWLQSIFVLYDTRFSEDKKLRRDENIRLLKNAVEAAENLDVKTESQAFLALMMWNFQYMKLDDKAPELVTMRRTIDELIETVLQHRPQHPAHHYKIHLWNDRTNDIQARESALVCGPANSGCAHLWHMPSHIFVNVGEYRNALYHFEAALRVDNKQLAARGLPASVIHNYAHNADYMLDVARRAGAVDRAVALATHLLKGPRHFRSSNAYIDPIDGMVTNFIDLLEFHLMWKEAATYVDAGYFEGLFDRASDLVARAKLLRFLGRVSIEKDGGQKVNDILLQLRKIRSEVKEKSEIEQVEKYEKDLTFWYTIRRSEPSELNGLTFPEQIIESMDELDVSNDHELALLAHTNGNIDLALKLAQKPVDAAPAFVVPRTVLAYLLREDAQGEKAQRVWKATLPLIHVPRAMDEGPHDSATYSVETAFPLIRKLLVNDQKSFLMDTRWEGHRQHDLRSWMKRHPAMKDLGPFELPAPQLPWADHFESLWAKLDGQMTEALRTRLQAKAQKGEWTLLVFRQAANCPACDEEQGKLMDQWAEEFRGVKVEPVVIRPDPNNHAGNITVLRDSELKAFKALGVFDEFTNKPFHAVFLVDEKGEVRWSERHPHAFDGWEGLLKETKRLQKLWN